MKHKPRRSRLWSRLYCLAGLAFACPGLTWAQDCYPAPIHKTLGHKIVQDALKQAWEDTLEGTPEEHEEGGWVVQCIGEMPSGNLGYELSIHRWPAGDHDSIRPDPPNMGPDCRIIASFHTHPGPEKTHPETDGYTNDKPSPADLENAVSRGVPGIIVYGTGLTFDLNITTRIITYGPTEPRTTCKDLGFSQAGVSGDPHLVTLDGLRYSLQAVGEFVLATNDRDLEIQTRFSPLQNSSIVSVVTAAALKLGTEKVMYDNQGVLRLNGEPVETLPEKIGDVQVTGRTLKWTQGTEHHFQWPNGTAVAIRRAGPFLSVDLITGIKSEWRGLLGNNDGDPGNDLQGRSGTITALNYENLYQQLAPAWAVSDDTTLFTYEPGTSSATFVDPSFPSNLVAIDDDERAAAKAACQRAGVWLEPTLSQCTFDYAVTSDEHMIQLALANHEAQFPRTKIVIDQPTISTESAVDVIDGGTLFEVHAPAGEEVSLSFDALAGITNANGRVVDLSGTIFSETGDVLDEFWPGNHGCRAYGPWVMPSSGLLHVAITSRARLGEDVRCTGSFKITLGKLARRVEAVTIKPQQSVVVTNRIDVRLDSISYQISAEPGSLLSAHMKSMNGQMFCGRGACNLTVRADHPDGKTLGTTRVGNWGCMACGPWQVPDSGRLDIVVTASEGDVLGVETGSFMMKIASLPEPKIIDLELKPDQRVHGEIRLPMQRQLYRLKAKTGSTFGVEVTSMGDSCDRGTWDVLVDVLDENQKLIQSTWPGNSGCQRFGPFTVPASGILLISPRGGDGKILKAPLVGDYEFVVRPL